jgi:hypothetical protein
MMPVEAATFISNLDKSWPLSQDGVNEGDNHLRLIKKVLQAQFPGSTNNGFNKAITSTEDELNSIGDILQWQIDAENTLYAPQGTLLMFGEAQVPTGWTVQNYGNTKALVIIDPSQGSSPGWQGGTDDPSFYNGQHFHTIAPHPDFQAALGSDLVIVGDAFTATDGNDWSPRYLEAVIAAKD